MYYHIYYTNGDINAIFACCEQEALEIAYQQNLIPFGADIEKVVPYNYFTTL